MRAFFLCLVLLSLTVFSVAQAKEAPPSAKIEFTDEICDDYQKIASEFIDMELSGLRWLGAGDDLSCLNKLKNAATVVDRAPASDPSLLDPEFLLPENRNVDFSVKRLPDDLLEVIMNYIGKRNKKDVAVKDRFLLKLNYGRNREAKGCASWFSEPDHFVMRSRCWKN